MIQKSMENGGLEESLQRMDDQLRVVSNIIKGMARGDG